MKKSLQLFLALLITASFNAGAQSFPFNDDFESYTAFQAPVPPYTGDMQVYLVHGYANSQGAIANMNSFNAVDSLITPLIGPIPMDCKLTFDWRIVDQALYPHTPATLTIDDGFDVYASTDGVNFNPFYSINQWNYLGDTAFDQAIVGMDNYLGQNVYLMFMAHRNGSGSSEFFFDIDNISIDQINSSQPVVKKEMTICPTLVNDQLNINYVTADQAPVTITDLAGKIIFSATLQKGDNRISLSQLSPGIYLVKAESQVEKIVKQ